MTYTMCSSVSVVNTLLDWYLQVSVCFRSCCPVFFTRQSSAGNSCHVFTRKCWCVWNWELRLRHTFRPWNNPHYTQPDQRNSLSNMILELHIQIYLVNTALLTSYASSKSLNYVFICIYSSMNIVPNMSIHRHRVKWLTYNTKTAKNGFFFFFPFFFFSK